MAATKRLKEPRLYVKQGESYASARRRWRKRYDAYRDALAMRQCGEMTSTRGKHLLRAFYGVSMGDVIDTGVLG
jgi:hypothetical protein